MYITNVDVISNKISVSPIIGAYLEANKIPILFKSEKEWYVADTLDIKDKIKKFPMYNERGEVINN